MGTRLTHTCEISPFAQLKMAWHTLPAAQQQQQFHEFFPSKAAPPKVIKLLTDFHYFRFSINFCFVTQWTKNISKMSHFAKNVRAKRVTNFRIANIWIFALKLPKLNFISLCVDFLVKIQIWDLFQLISNNVLKICAFWDEVDENWYSF